MLHKTCDFNVCDDYIVYALYGDASIFDYNGDDGEQKKVDDWFKTIITEMKKEYGENLISYHWSVDSDEGEYRKCNITGLYANTVILTINIMLQ